MAAGPKPCVGGTFRIQVAMDFETDRDLATPNLRGSTALFGRPVAGHRGKEVFRFATSRVPKARVTCGSRP